MAQEQIKKGDWVRYMDDPPFKVSENETPEKIAFMNTDSSYEKVTEAAQEQTRKGDGLLTEKQELPFSVYTYSLMNMADFGKWEHWSKGLKMTISKGGVTVKLEEDEIKQLVASLPKTFGGSY